MYTQEEIWLGEMMEAQGLSHSQIDEYFEHHGVKGQKWGIRNQRKRDFADNRLKMTKRVASGKGDFTDKFVVAGRQSVISLLRNKGLKGAAAKEVFKLEASKKRLERGQGTVNDILRRNGLQLVNLG